MVPARVRHRIFDIKQALRNPDDVREYRELLSRHEANPKALIRLQQDRALALTRHAFRTSPFYREHYTRAGLDLRDLHDPQVLAALPIVERADLRDNFDRVRSRDVGPSDVEMHVTGGSTGEPLRVLWDRRLPGNAIGWRMRIGWGVHPGDPLAKVWRATRPPHERGRRLRRLRTWPSPRVTMDCTHLGEADIVRFLDEWNRIRPRLLIGFVGGLLEVAQYLLDSGRTIAPPVAIEATASPMTASQKAMLGEAFGAPVYDVYQSNEVPVMAGECTRRNGLHVFSDIRRIEIVDDDGRPVPPGAPGSVVVTDLRNRAFPIIRYRQGDVASWKVDGCGCRAAVPGPEPGARSGERQPVLPERPHRVRRHHARHLLRLAGCGAAVPTGAARRSVAHAAVRAGGQPAGGIHHPTGRGRPRTDRAPRGTGAAGDRRLDPSRPREDALHHSRGCGTRAVPARRRRTWEGGTARRS